MELKQLKYFEAVASAGSFSMASAMLSIVQPALSRQIAKLEQELGCRLFYRNGRGVELTDDGRKLQQAARSITGTLDGLSRDLQHSQATLRGDVMVGLPPSVCATLGVRLTLRMRQEYPEIKLRMVDGFSGLIAEWLLSGRLDLGAIHEERAASGMRQDALLNEPLFVIGQPDARYGLNNDDPTVDFSALQVIPLVQFSPTHGVRRLLDKHAHEAGIQINEVAQIDTLVVLRQLVRKPDFYVISPFGYFEEDCLAGEIGAWQLRNPGLRNVLQLAISPNRPYTEATAAVRRILLEEAAQLQMAIAS